ncbi:hypothetical protein ACJX0J_025633, partial [Zea mays]
SSLDYIINNLDYYNLLRRLRGTDLYKVLLFLGNLGQIYSLFDLYWIVHIFLRKAHWKNLIDIYIFNNFIVKYLYFFPFCDRSRML